MTAELLLDVDNSTGSLKYLFTVRDSDGVLESSSTTPTATLWLDGAATAQTATVTNPATGKHYASATFSSITKSSRASLAIGNVTVGGTLQPEHHVDLPVREAKTIEDIANSVRNAVLDRVLDGNHDVSGSVGEKLQESGTVVLPTSATVPSRGDETSVFLYLGETISTSFTITDQAGDPVDLSGRTLELAVETLTGTDVTTIEDGSITVSGGSNQTATVTWPSAVTDSVRSLRMFLRDTDNGEVLVDGKIHVDYSAESD